MKKIITLFILVMFMATFAGCVILGTVPPGQIKKQTAPGQIKKR